LEGGTIVIYVKGSHIPL